MFGRIALALFVLCAGLAAPSRAQDSSSVYTTSRPGSGGGPLQWLFGRSRSDAKIIRVPREARPRVYEPRRRSSSYASRPAFPRSERPDNSRPQQETYGPPAPDVASAPQQVDDAPLQPAAPGLQVPPVTVAVVGDSLSIFLAQGLQEAYADRPGVTFLKRNREASGLVREDYYDWQKQLRDLIATTPKLDAIIIQLGSNDRQQLRDGTAVLDPLTERWRELYIRRIDEMIAIARERKIPLLWVGLPVMRGERFNADMLVITDMFKARSHAAGVPYIDVWETFAGEDGTYVVNGPDIDGTIVRLRTADGVHFTRAGARKLAFFVDKELKRIIAAVQDRAPVAPSPPPAMASLPASQPPAISGLLPVLPPLPEPQLPAALKSNDTLLGVPLPDPAVLTALAPRPAQGAVIPLNAPTLSPGAVLIPARDTAASALAADADARPMHKPGRADDFRANPR